METLHRQVEMRFFDNVTIWDILIIAGAFLVLIWAFLKALSIIHSPAWVEMLPFFGVGASIIGAAYKLGRIKQSVDDTGNKVDRLLKMETSFHQIESEHHLAMEGKLKFKH
ncbi:MAG: hypothetical protein PHE43_03245 [Candidatus Nanoarchaeia archaeon]|nr:hypothetical protein [Candidatus Nanoarchaeia archaeon]